MNYVFREEDRLTEREQRKRANESMIKGIFSMCNRKNILTWRYYAKKICDFFILK